MAYFFYLDIPYRYYITTIKFRRLFVFILQRPRIGEHTMSAFEARSELNTVTALMMRLDLLTKEDVKAILSNAFSSSEDEIKTMQLDLILAVSEDRKDARFYDELNKFLPKELRKNTREGKIVEYTNFSKQEDTRFEMSVKYALFEMEDGTFASYIGDPMEWEGWYGKYATLQEAIADGFTED